MPPAAVFDDVHDDLAGCRDDLEQAILREGGLKLRDDFGSYFGRAQVFWNDVVVSCKKLRGFAVCATSNSRIAAIRAVSLLACTANLASRVSAGKRSPAIRGFLSFKTDSASRLPPVTCTTRVPISVRRPSSA
jgi:hypothetical protein